MGNAQLTKACLKFLKPLDLQKKKKSVQERKILHNIRDIKPFPVFNLLVLGYSRHQGCQTYLVIENLVACQ